MGARRLPDVPGCESSGNDVPDKYEAERFPVETGIPLSESAVSEVSQIRLFAKNQVVPADCSPLMFWPDGSRECCFSLTLSR